MTTEGLPLDRPSGPDDSAAGQRTERQPVEPEVLTFTSALHGDDSVVVSAAGVIGLASSRKLEDNLTRQIESGRTKVVLEMRLVALVDSAGITALLRLHRLASELGGWLRLANPQPRVRRVFQTTNLDRLITMYDTVEDALDAG